MKRNIKFILSLILIALTVCGCVCEPSESVEVQGPNRFICELVESEISQGSHLDYLIIVTDTETGVQYLIVDGDNGVGVTVLQPKEE